MTGTKDRKRSCTAESVFEPARSAEFVYGFDSTGLRDVFKLIPGPFLTGLWGVFKLSMPCFQLESGTIFNCSSIRFQVLLAAFSTGLCGGFNCFLQCFQLDSPPFSSGT